MSVSCVDSDHRCIVMWSTTSKSKGSFVVLKTFVIRLKYQFFRNCLLRDAIGYVCDPVM